jgi:UDP-N-acetylmuramyl pentapeptide synthase
MFAAPLTLDALTLAPGRRIAVLGEMLNMGHYQEEVHRELGRLVPGFVDYLITCGEYAAFIAETAQQVGMDSTHILTTSTPEDAAQIVRHILEQSRDFVRPTPSLSQPENLVQVNT